MAPGELQLPLGAAEAKGHPSSIRNMADRIQDRLLSRVMRNRSAWRTILTLIWQFQLSLPGHKCPTLTELFFFA